MSNVSKTANSVIENKNKDFFFPIFCVFTSIFQTFKVSKTDLQILRLTFSTMIKDSVQTLISVKYGILMLATLFFSRLLLLITFTLF